jgi:hypothetical protein
VESFAAHPGMARTGEKGEGHVFLGGRGLSLTMPSLHPMLSITQPGGPSGRGGLPHHRRTAI